MNFIHGTFENTWAKYLGVARPGVDNDNNNNNNKFISLTLPS